MAKRMSKKITPKGQEPVFEALVELECSMCGKTIEPGERFVRQLMIGGGSRHYPRSLGCDKYGRYFAYLQEQLS
jgi:hypothetical protein